MTQAQSEQPVPEHDEVAGFAVDNRALVDAPAGTGKTHVLARRLTTLVDRDDLNAGDELLVLSFSRAAVTELRSRVGRLGGDARYVGASTFDSFATQLLAAEDPGGSWTSAGYDARIDAAVELLRGSEDLDSIGIVSHVLIDEVQDLVGRRAALVMALLDRHAGGFTLFGDPAQAIYDYQNGSGGPTNADLYQWIEETFGRTLLRRRFTRDFRGRTPHHAEIAAIGEQLRCRQADQQEISSSLRSLLLALPSTSIGAARRLLTRADGTVAAVLCRTNAQALRLSAELSDRGIRHRYQRRGEDKAAASWLSRAVLDVKAKRTTRSVLMPDLEEAAEVRDVSGPELFSVLRRLAPSRGEDVDLEAVADRLRAGAFPEELNDVLPQSVVVSTIHRAKGLEFDRVLMSDHDERPDDDVGAENRLQYVALSRARYEIFHLPAPDTAGLRVDQTTGRWVRTGFGRNRWRVFEVEVFGSDSDAVRPVSGWLADDDGPESQLHLLSKVQPGDRVDVELLESPAHEETPRYVFLHDSRAVGVTSERFGDDLKRLLGQTSRMPRALSGLHVEMVDTVAGDASEARRAGLGIHGIWARTRVFGFGRLVFGDGSEK